MDKVLIVLKNITVAIFLVVLSFAYYDMGEGISSMIILFLDNQGLPGAKIDRSWFFYGLSLFVVLFNALIATAIQLLRRYPIQALPVAKADFWHANEENLIETRSIWVGWLAALGIFANLWLLTMVIRVWFIHRTLIGTVEAYHPFWIVLLVFLLGWMIFPSLRFRSLPKADTAIE
ncbi:hypothetical protein [Eisenibacter elegans]|jgi:hypothetical protein|uniref:hypothetical protein n=1 Tax=Eisenibacter elegans TaxID=997 RepID=UPI000422A9F0|nr:hypothetical protein [Eisenibacter elegans]